MATEIIAHLGVIFREEIDFGNFYFQFGCRQLRSDFRNLSFEKTTVFKRPIWGVLCLIIGTVLALIGVILGQQ